jgi:hypothetical protein
MRRSAWECLILMLRGNNDQCTLTELLQLTGVIERDYRRLSDPSITAPRPAEASKKR